MDRGISRGHALIGAAVVCCLLVAPIAVAGSVGDPEATASSVKKQVKKLKKRVKALENQAQVPGPQGPPGKDATALFAYVRDQGSGSAARVGYGSGVTAVNEPQATEGVYFLTFNRSLQNCVAQANVGFGDPAGTASFPSDAIANVVLSEGAANQLLVGVTDVATSSGVDSSFLISVFC